MSKGRRATLTKLLQQEQRKKHVIVPFPTWMVPTEQVLAEVADGEVKQLVLGWTGCAWIWVYRFGQSFLACTPLGRVPAEVVEAYLRQQGAELRKQVVKVPRPLGNRARTLAAREAVAESKRSPAPAVVRTRLARCAGCGTKTEIAAGDARGICATCGQGGL